MSQQMKQPFSMNLKKKTQNQSWYNRQSITVMHQTQLTSIDKTILKTSKICIKIITNFNRLLSLMASIHTFQRNHQNHWDMKLKNGIVNKNHIRLICNQVLRQRSLEIAWIYTVKTCLFWTNWIKLLLENHLKESKMQTTYFIGKNWVLVKLI